jgi:hypothetical protein
MGVVIKFTGLEGTLKELRNLPVALAGDGRSIVIGWGNYAVASMRQAYPVFTGNLVRGVKQVVKSTGPFGVDVQVKNTAPHAKLFEIGTQGRHRYTKKGAHRGAMPAGRVFVPIMISVRRRMYEDLKALLARAGLKVSGDA